MKMYDVIMMHPAYKKEMLIEFGFGEFSPLEVERWFRQTYPMTNKQYKENLKYVNELINEGTIVVPFKLEAMTQQERSVMVDYAMDNVDVILDNIEKEKQDLLDRL